MASSPFQKILVPVDFSETSRRALDHAIELARKLGASITVMHARQMPVFDLPDGGFVPTAEQAARFNQAAQDGMDAMISTRKDQGVPLTTALRDGDPREEIAAYAEEMGADLVVMGTHGRGPLARALLGSVAPQVIRSLRQPVLMIPGPR